MLFTGAYAASKTNMADARAKRRMTKEFMDVMNEPNIAAARKRGQAQRLQNLNDALMHASRKLQNNGQWNGQQGYYGQQGQQNMQGQQGYYNQQGQQGYNGQGQNMNDMNYQNGQNAQNAEYNYQDGGIPFDITERAFKYSGCAAIKSYDAERAQQNGNPMVMDNYAVFRLCPANKCNEYSMTGCSSNYGEYAVEMSTYLAYILEYYDQRFEQYCEYCLPCDWEYQAEAKTALNQCYAMTANGQEYQAAYQYNSGANNNYNNYNKNNGGNAYGGNGNYNGNANYQAANGNNGGRKMYQYGSYYSNGGDYGADNYYANAEANQQYEENQQENMDANAQAYGYYDENGDWVAGQGGVQENTGAGFWGQDGNWYPYDQALQYVCRDGSQCDFCQYSVEEQYMYCDNYVCSGYYDYCTDMYGDNQQEQQFDIRNYVTCEAFENEYGRYYIGPHCGSDHYTVSLGVFSDENCVDYIGDTVSLKTVLGYQYKDEDLFKFPKECINCDGTVEYAEQQQQQQEDEEAGRYGQYVSAPTDEDGVVAMCSALYEGSAQCNMHMNNFQAISYFMSAQEKDQEEHYCAFIDNIISGSFDESGEIVLRGDNFDISDWRNIEQYKKIRMPADQAILLSLSVILVVALFAAAAMTNRQLRRQSTPWRPKVEPADLSRQNSGIVMGRSRSGAATAPLI